MKFKAANFISLIFVLAVFFFTAEHASACLCAIPGKTIPLSEAVKNERTRAAAVFTGEVIAVGNYAQGKREIIFKVKKSWKGVAAAEISLMTGYGGSDCGYVFEVGKSYLVYAFGENQQLLTHICSRTAALDTRNIRQEIKALNKLKKES